MQSLRIGVAGAGVFGSYHAAKYAALDNVRLVSVFDQDASRAQMLGEKSDATPLCDYDTFLDSVDAVVLTTPAITHFELGERALKAAKHLFVEKPLASSAAAANALVEIARDADVILQAGHQERYVCEAIGLFSRARAPQRIECVRHVPFTGRCGDVSAVLDLMVHDLDLVRTLTSAEPLNISADGERDGVAAELFLANGTLATLSARRSAKSSDRRMTLIYDDGVIEFDFIRRTLANSTPATLFSVFDYGTPPLAIRDPLAYGAELFANSIIQGRTLGVAGEDAAAIIEWARKIEAAAGLEAAGDVDLRKRVRG